MQYVTTVSSKGQIVIPKAIRDELELSPSALISISVIDGNIIAEPMTQSDTMFGSFKVKSPINKDKVKEIYKAAILTKTRISNDGV